MEELVKEQGARKVLEVGFGFGQQLFQLAQSLGEQGVGVDLYGFDMTYSRVACSRLLHL